MSTSLSIGLLLLWIDSVFSASLEVRPYQSYPACCILDCLLICVCCGSCAFYCVLASLSFQFGKYIQLTFYSRPVVVSRELPRCPLLSFSFSFSLSLLPFLPLVVASKLQTFFDRGLKGRAGSFLSIF